MNEKLIYVALLAAAAGDLIPTPADAWYFSAQSRLKQELEEGKITPKHYWVWDAIYYYSLNPLYWLILALIAYSINGDYHVKLKMILVILAGGLVVTAILKNIKKDEERQLADKLKNAK